MTLRITGGAFKGQTLTTPSHLKTRPTQAKLRQALFNSIQTRIPDARVLDLFAGSGALGFEALSRGAKEVVFVESSKSVCSVIQKNAQTLKVSDQVSVIMATISPQFKLKQSLPFDLVLADPPYGYGWEMKLPMDFDWESTLSVEGLFCLEWAVQKNSPVRELPEKIPFLVKIREKHYGDTMLTTYMRADQ